MRSHTRSTKLQRAGVLAVAGAVSFLGLSFGSPASATISFCQTGPNKPCIGPINGCAMVLGDGRYAFAENGDSVVTANGETRKCENGTWVTVIKPRVSTFQIETVAGSTLGRGILFQGSLSRTDCDLNSTFCPIE